MNKARMWSIYVPEAKQWIKERIESVARAKGITAASHVLGILEREAKGIGLYEQLCLLETELRLAGDEREADAIRNAGVIYRLRHPRNNIEASQGT